MKSRVIHNLDEAKSLLNISMTAGLLLIRNGAEIYRAEDTIERMISSAENMREVDVFALSSALFVSAEFEDETITMFKDVETDGIHLARIDALNTFSRHFVSGDISLNQARNELLDISKLPKRSFEETMFFTGLCSASFAIMFGGNWYDFSYTFFVGFILNYCLRLMAKHQISFFPEAFLGTLVVSSLALIGSINFELLHIDMIIIGGIMPLVPGMAITNSFRDIISGDYVSGLIGITRGIFVALAIALGVGVILNFQKIFGG